MLILGITTSSSRFAIVFGEQNKVLFNSEEHELSGTMKDIDLLVKTGLEHINRKVNEIKRIIVDKGPGGTSSVRTGVAYANALAYSLGIDLFAISSFELLGYDLYSNKNIPVLLTAKSIKGNVFIGYYSENKLQSISYGNIETTLEKVMAKHEEFLVAGPVQDAVKEVLSDKIIHLSDKKFGDVNNLIEKDTLFCRHALNYPEFAIPITEQTLK